MSDSNGIALTRLEQPVEIFANFCSVALPDALDAFLFRVDARDAPSGIERFAFATFRDIDLRRLRSLMLKSRIRLCKQEDNRFYLAFDEFQVSKRDKQFLLSVESAINRVQFCLSYLGFSSEPATSSPSAEDCSLIEQRILTTLTSGAQDLIQTIDQPNPWMDCSSSRPAVGGEWDLRSRFAKACSKLDVVVRLEFTYDCLASAKVMRIRFRAPDASEMPRRILDAKDAQWIELSWEKRCVMAKEYGYRIALLLAAAGFASGILIERCSLEMYDASMPDGTIRLQFERAEFLGRYLDLASSLSGQPLDGTAARGLADAMVKRIAALRGARGRKLAPGRDDRALPEALRELLLADAVSDLEVMESPDSRSRNRVNELKAMLATDRAAALDGLKALIESLEATCVANELLSDVPMRSQFCENYIGRILLPLDEDDRATRIQRVPDALYFARYELVNASMRDGDLEAALIEARRLLDIASTSMQAHFALINVLGALGRHQDLIEVAEHGLGLACDRDSAAYLFYRIAYSLWQVGSRDEALASYSMVLGDDHLRDQVNVESACLMRQMGVETPPSPEDAALTLAAAGLPLPPTDQVRRQLCDALVLFTEGGFHFLACRCATYLSDLLGDKELSAMSGSFT
ncbi:hypothetical protein Corgl_0475 [Coriobacterium glomerans PW2]|uniref:Tetratricopeptide repeat protein n=1 Tax=Coriobacterium glomerans (strain ATCC 49209 / DSM 20642 / JCM 10262 / PW2) TaxID=700015 RepID=F2N7B8_CORGP|nr:hypothetical protein [Coriobacterium glomerans]AEB06593.1 hypothetical protein Corgl_0475 [Coriobacterium glomerans PW2]